MASEWDVFEVPCKPVPGSPAQSSAEPCTFRANQAVEGRLKDKGVRDMTWSPLAEFRLWSQHLTAEM